MYIFIYVYYNTFTKHHIASQLFSDYVFLHIYIYIYIYMLMIYVYIYNTYRRLNQTLPGLFCELRLVSLLRSFSSMLVREAREAKLSLGFSHGDFPCHGGTPIAGWSAWLILIGKSHNKNG